MRIFNFKKNKESINTFFLVVGFGIVFICLNFFLYKCGMVQNIPNANTLLHWDAGIYQDVMIHGYNYDHPEYSNSGFFIFFPYVWRMLHTDVIGICCFNYLCFAVGFTLISSLYKLSTNEKLLWLSIPTVYMMMIPYTEAVFFLLISVSFYGIIKKKRWMMWAGLFFASMTRPTGIFLLPAFLVMELLCEDNSIQWKEILWRYCVNYALPVIAGVIFFTLYQHHVIGVWFAYITLQQKYQGHTFSMPVLPLSSLEGPRILWVSALAVFCCCLAVVVISAKIFGRLLRKIIEPDKLFVVSTIYLCITLYKTIFYNPKWAEGRTVLEGISRYVFATPFFYVFLYHFNSRKIPYKPLHFILVFLLCNIVWLACGSYLHILSFLYFNFVTLMVMMCMLLPDKRYTWPIMALITMNELLQMFAFQQFIGGGYLD